MSLIVADIEADGLFSEWEAEAATRIDCLVMDIDGCVWDFSDSLGFSPHFQPNDVIVFHNGIDYDLPMIKKFWGLDYSIGPDTWDNKAVKHVDTMLLSKVVDPDRKLPKGFAAQWKPSRKGERLPGPHSLEVWAYRLDLVKPKLVYGENMGNIPYEISVAQATADVQITKALYFHLLQEIKTREIDLRKPMAVENKVRFIISEGAQTGVPFNSELAERCLVDLDAKMLSLAEAVEPHLPPRAIPTAKIKNPPKKRLNKDSTPSKLAIAYFGDKLTQFEESGLWYVKYFEDKGECVLLTDANEPLVATEPMKISDSKDVKIWLQNDYGWKPTLWNTVKDASGKKVRTSPKFHEKGKLCVNLEALGDDIAFIKDIVLYLSYRNRRSVIKSKDANTGWLNHPRLAIDGRLPADADTIGCNTFRFKHRIVTNVPRPSSIYGEEMRDMFMAPEGYKFVGWDAAGLEDRVKAHYCYKMPGGREYAEKLLNPDFSVHEENMQAWKLPKGKCKNGHYAMQYNCRAPKLAETLGIEQALADEYYDAWWANNEPLAAFQDHVAIVWSQFSKKWVPTIDGRWVPCTMEYMLVSRLFQSAGIIVMKYAMVLWHNKIRRLGLDAEQVIAYHDEADCLVHPDHAEEVGEIGCWSIKRAGEILNFNVPMLSDYKIGNTWKDIH